MAALDIQPGIMSPTIVYPEISNPIKKSTPISETQASSQQKSIPDQKNVDQVGKQQDLEEFLKMAGKHVEGYDPNTSELSVGVDKDTHRIVVKLLNSRTKELIRQIPPEEILRIARNLRKMEVGLLDEMA
jgi:flagellar protein FlaG